MSDQIKARFAPSPTGFIHLGNARTALFNDLFIRKNQGIFLLRIEDTDAERSKAEYDAALQQDLRWLGLIWQEGPGADQGHGPYYQSQRQAIYDKYYQQLEIAGLAYPCFCTEAQLALARKVQQSSGKPPRYAGTCRSLSKEDIEKKLAEGLKPTLRFRLPDQVVVTFQDLVRGEQRFDTRDMGDFIIRRANGTPPFMYCSVIDDALMGVTHVLRGEDHLANTPRQILLIQALGMKAPQYGHISLITGPDGSPLSKRHGSRSISELREQGYVSLAIDNYMARLGHYYTHDKLLSLDELAAEFELKNLSKSPAKFNQQQMDFFQKQAVEKMSAEEFWQWIEKFSPVKVEKNRELLVEAIKPNVLFPQEAAYWINICYGDMPDFNEDQKALLKNAGTQYFDEALNALAKTGKDFKAMTAHVQEKLGVKGKALYQPLRVALTGNEHGPEMAKLLLLMDDAIIKKRLEMARN